MTIAVKPAEMAATIEGPTLHQFTVDEYHRMGEAGLLPEGIRTELLDGVIYEMTPIGPPHAWGTDDLTAWFVKRLGGRAHVANQRPLALGDKSEPQPDLMLLRSGVDRRRHPTPADVLLIVELADSTSAHDLEHKSLRYAQANVPDYWVYLLNGPELVVFRNPSPEGYKLIQRHSPGEPVGPLAFPDVSFDLAELEGEA